MLPLSRFCDDNYWLTYCTLYLKVKVKVYYLQYNFLCLRLFTYACLWLTCLSLDSRAGPPEVEGVFWWLYCRLSCVNNMRSSAFGCGRAAHLPWSHRLRSPSHRLHSGAKYPTENVGPKWSLRKDIALSRCCNHEHLKVLINNSLSDSVS